MVEWESGVLGSEVVSFLTSGVAFQQVSAPLESDKKKSTKINFLGLETARWGGGLPPEGVVAKNFVLSLESLSSLGFEERNLG